MTIAPAPGQNPDEVFDVVDERDHVVGQATRREVHARGLRHRAVHVLVTNAAGAVLLQQRSLAKDTAPGRWDTSAAGHVDSGESYDACAARELTEELGVAGATPARLFYLAAQPATGQEFVWVYHLRHEGPFAFPPAEIQQVQWFAPAAIAAWIARAPGDFASAFVLLFDLWQRAGRPQP